jgi:EAL domain-containing protein (putative c-di-GMP-specific phosphodiesterase class I)
MEPDRFIGRAEETGLIVPIGFFVLEEVCHQTSWWQHQRPDRMPIRISVNLAPRQLLEPSLVPRLSDILAESRLEPASLWLELTEGALMADPDDAIKTLRAVGDLGVHLAVDDFGTGYSSMAYLKRFPVEALKIDRSFVSGLGQNPGDTSIVRAVIGLAHSLDLLAIAEGLETDAQLRELRTLGCDYAQGFLFGRPRPASALGEHPAEDLRFWHTPITP